MSDFRQPGKVRTWWHPILARMFDYTVGDVYKVDEEVSVGKMPVRVHILLLRREGGQRLGARSEELSALLPLLNRFTLIEFKSPIDSMQQGDFAQLVGCAYLWHSQQRELVPRQEVTLIVLAPTVTEALGEELRALGCDADQQQAGIFRVSGLPFATWVVETDVMAARLQPVLSLVSRLFRNDSRRIIEGLERTGHGRLVSYVMQQMEWLRSREDFAVQYADVESMDLLEDEILAQIPVEKRLRGVTAEERLRGLAPEEVLRVVSSKEFVAGLTAEQAAKLRELLLQRPEDR